MSASTRWLIAVAGVIALAVVASAAVSVIANQEQEFPAGSPEAAVQDYLHAVAHRDATEALSYLSADLEDRCADFPRDAIEYRGDNRFRARLDEAEARSGTFEVRVEITEFYGGGPFGGGESTYEHTFVLVQEDGAWRFDEAPWPLYCAQPITPAVPKPAS